MGNCAGMGNRHPADRLHGLDGNGRPEVESDENFKETEGNENSKGIHLIEGDITDNKGDQGTQVPKSARKLHFVIFIPPQPHGYPLRKQVVTSISCVRNLWN